MTKFTHIQGDSVHMVEVGEKEQDRREAIATGKIHLRPETLEAIRCGSTVKGNVLATATVAATLAVKDTSRVIPMSCHPCHRDRGGLHRGGYMDRGDSQGTVVRPDRG